MTSQDSKALDTQHPESHQAAKPAHPHIKIGLALGAGAARGWSHIGVVERLVEVGINPAMIAGTSIGALVGGFHAAGKLDRLKTFALSLTRRRLFSFLDISWSGSGLISGGKLNAMLDDEIGGANFDSLAIPFICIATELMTGHEIWLREGKVAPAMRASYALPGVFRPVSMHGQWLIDGAVVNPIPVSACRAMGARLVIAVNLNTDAFGGTVIQQQEDPSSLSHVSGNGDDMREKQTILRQMIGSHSDPGLTTVLVAAFNISQDRLSRSRLAGDPPDVIIGPRTPDIGLFEFDRAAEAIEEGRNAVDRILPEIEAALSTLERATPRDPNAFHDL